MLLPDVDTRVLKLGNVVDMNPFFSLKSFSIVLHRCEFTFEFVCVVVEITPVLVGILLLLVLLLLLVFEHFDSSLSIFIFV